MIERYEKQIALVEREKKSLEKELSSFNACINVGTIFDSVCEFISNPIQRWECGGLEEKRQVLELIFSEKISYNREKGFGTAEKSFIFNMLDRQKSDNYQVATNLRRIPNYLS